MNFSVEMYVEEKGFVQEKRGYLRDSKIELEDLLKWTKSQLILISDQVLTEEQARGFDKTPLRLVDGSQTKRVSDVSPLGQIEFISKQDLAAVLTDTYEALLELSKVKTGLYKSSHHVFLNREQVATDLESLKVWLNGNPQIKDSDLVSIVNIQPYGRRLELLGVTAQRQQSRKREKRKQGSGTGVFLKVPNGAYQLASRRMKAKYGKNVTVIFTFIPGTQLGLKDYFKKTKLTKGRIPRSNSSGRVYLYPSITFKLNKGGLF